MVPKKNRQYASRLQILIKHSFDPYEDLIKNEDGVWELPDHKPKLARDIWKFFECRREDEDYREDAPLSPFTPTLSYPENSFKERPT